MDAHVVKYRRFGFVEPVRCMLARARDDPGRAVNRDFVRQVSPRERAATKRHLVPIVPAVDDNS